MSFELSVKCMNGGVMNIAKVADELLALFRPWEHCTRAI